MSTHFAAEEDAQARSLWALEPAQLNIPEPS